MLPNRFNKQQYEGEINSIAKQIKKVFAVMRCSVEGHRSAPTSFCYADQCERRLLCPECLVQNTKHTIDHQATTITIGGFLEQVLVYNIDSYVINQFKLQEINEFYETFWRGLNLCYKVTLAYL